jgi:hypothetical protein
MSSSTGPDKVLPATKHISTDPSVPVKLRVRPDSPPDDATPVSVSTLLTKVAEHHGDTLALAVKRPASDGAEPDWIKWTYNDYLRDVRTAAKGLIKYGLEPRCHISY